MITHETSSLTTPDGHPLFTQGWLPDAPPRAALIIQHGLGEHSQRYDHVGRYFAERGYAVHAMDLRGHGRSANGDMGYFARFDTLVEDLKQLRDSLNLNSLGNAQPVFLIGHSMGSLLAMCYAIRYGDTLRPLILSGTGLDAGASVPAAAIQVAKVLGRLTPRFGIMAVNSGTISRDPAVTHKTKGDPLVYHGKVKARVGSEMLRSSAFAKANLDKIHLPVLILHGGADRLIDPASSHFAHAHVSSVDKTLTIYDEVFHEIFNEPEQATVLGDVFTWLDAH